MNETTLPVPEPLAPVDKPFTDYRARDTELYNAWNADKSKQNMGALVKALHPLIFAEVRRSSGTLPEAALSAEAKKWAVRSILSYDPSKGAALSTHVVHGLMRTRRQNYRYQNSARLPENLHLKYTEFSNNKSHLENVLGREPTDAELAHELGWSKALVVKFKGSLYEDLVESANVRPIETTQFDTNSFLMDHVMSKLDEQEKTLLLHKGDMSATALADKLGVNISRLNYLSAKLRDKIAKIKEEIGMF